MSERVSRSMPFFNSCFGEHFYPPLVAYILARNAYNEVIWLVLDMMECSQRSIEIRLQRWAKGISNESRMVGAYTK